MCLTKLERLHFISRFKHRVPAHHQNLSRESPYSLVRLQQQDRLATSWQIRFFSDSDSLTHRVREGKENSDCSPDSLLAANVNVTSALFNDAISHGHPQPLARPALPSREERLEHMGLRLGVHSASRVSNLQPDESSWLQSSDLRSGLVAELDALGVDGRSPAAGHRLACVYRDSQNGVLQARAIDPYPAEVGIGDPQNGYVSAHKLAYSRIQLRQQRVQVKHPGPEHLLLTEGEQRLGDSSRLFRCLLHLVCVGQQAVARFGDARMDCRFFVVRRLKLPNNQAGIAADRSQQV